MHFDVYLQNLKTKKTMANKNLHDRPFDEGTITKLEIFENYAKEWLPTFIMSCPDKDLWIFDFFAGPGRDKRGIAGSPIRTLQQIKAQSGNIFQKRCRLHVCLNEFDSAKVNTLKQCCEQFINDNPELSRLRDKYLFLDYQNEDFAKLFHNYYGIMYSNPSLVFLDQNGMKFLAEKYLSSLDSLPHIDFLYYLSSSYFNRFGDTPAFQTNMKIDMEKVRQNPYKYIHRSILEQIKEHLPQGSSLKLYPFTIKKGPNIYGIIFGAKHPLAVDKFLRTAWRKNSINGEANFDIDDDTNKNQLDIFGKTRQTKIESFQSELRRQVLNGFLKTNKDVFDYTLEQGHISQHASDELKKMKKEDLIDYEERTPLVNYNNVYKERRIISYKIKK